MMMKMMQTDTCDVGLVSIERLDDIAAVGMKFDALLGVGAAEQHDDALAVTDEPVRFTHIREHVGKRLNSAPVFYQKVQRTPGDFDFPYWVDDKQFDLDFHVRHLALPPPGGDGQLREMISQILSQPLDRERPLWEIWVIEGLSGDRFGMLSKIHHCMVDGMGGMEAMSALQEADPAVKAIVSSGYSDDPAIANHDQYGFCEVVAKPFEMIEFSQKLHKVVNTA